MERRWGWLPPLAPPLIDDLGLWESGARALDAAMSVLGTPVLTEGLLPHSLAKPRLAPGFHISPRAEQKEEQAERPLQGLPELKTCQQHPHGQILQPRDGESALFHMSASADC